MGNCKRLLLQNVVYITEGREITAEIESLGSSDIIPNPFCPLEWYEKFCTKIHLPFDQKYYKNTLTVMASPACSNCVRELIH